MPVRAVLFDAGETLVHPAPSFPELFTHVLARRRPSARSRRGARGLAQRVPPVLRGRARQRALDDHARSDPSRFWKGVYDRMLEELGLARRRASRDDAVRDVHRPARTTRCSTTCVPALDALEAAGLALGIVSNFEAWLEDLLGALGVRDRFPVRVISGRRGRREAGRRGSSTLALRADRRSTRPTRSTSATTRSSTWSRRARVGMMPVLIDRRGRFPDADCVRIADLRDLPGGGGRSHDDDAAVHRRPRRTPSLPSSASGCRGCATRAHGLIASSERIEDAVAARRRRRRGQRLVPAPADA